MSNDIFVITEYMRDSISEPTYELLGLARCVSNSTGGKVIAVLLGWKVDAFTEQLGSANQVIYLEHEALAEYSSDAWKQALFLLLKEKSPRITLFSSSSFGTDLAGPISATLDWSLTSFAHDIVIEGDRTVVSSQLYGGKANIETEFRGPGIVQVRTGVLEPVMGSNKSIPQVVKIAPAIEASKIYVKCRGQIELPAGDVDITREKVLVSVGRGIERKENLPPIEDLALALGGVLSASRPVVDQGWLPRTRQVGKSGAAVKPKLYLALGISGAPEHVEGMKNSELIIAINTDLSAPIFETAHYGAIGDLHEIVASLVEKIKGSKGN